MPHPTTSMPISSPIQPISVKCFTPLSILGLLWLLPDHLTWSTNSNFMAWHQHSWDGNHQSTAEKWLSTHWSTSLTQHRFHRTLPWWSLINSSEIWTTNVWQLATWQWCHMPATTHLFSATIETLIPVTYLCYLQMEPLRSQLSKEPLIATSLLMKDKDLSLA